MMSPMLDLVLSQESAVGENSTEATVYLGGIMVFYLAVVVIVFGTVYRGWGAGGKR